MRSVVLALILCNTFLAVAQSEVPLDISQSDILLQEFIAENVDSVRKHCQCEQLFFIVSYEHETPSELSFYRTNKEGGPAKVWEPLAEYANHLFKFIPEIRPSSSWGSIEATIVLNKEMLLKRLEWYKRIQQAESAKRPTTIQRDAKYTLKVNELHCPKMSRLELDDIKFSRLEETVDLTNIDFSSQLNGLDSNLIWLDDKTAIWFRVIMTSFEGLSSYEYEWRIYHDMKLIYSTYSDYSSIKQSFPLPVNEHFNPSGKDFVVDIKLEFDDK